MFIRLGLTATAALALAAGGAQACEQRPAARPMAAHAAPHRLTPVCRVYHKVRLRHVRRRFVAVAQPVAYERHEAVTVSDSYSYREISDDRYYDGRAAGQAHLSATDSYGYLTWPGKFRSEGYVEDAGPRGLPTCRAPIEVPPDRYSGQGDPR